MPDLYVGKTFSDTDSFILSSNQVIVANFAQDPRLLPLADNGGAVPTHALHSDSPAIDMGNNQVNARFDGRGTPFSRVVGVRADAGAFEFTGTEDKLFADGFEQVVPSCIAPQ